jgi:hypothetical protein
MRRSSFSSILTGALLVPLLGAADARAFVPTPVGGHPGEVDLSLRAGFERGLIEPNEFDGSWQKARWNLYQAGVGYTIGTVGPFDDFFIRLDNTFYTSPAETSDPDDLAFPERGSPAACITELTAEGFCEFHPADSGWLITPSIGANLVHKADFSFGVFLQGTIPISVNLAKFALPRVDWIAGGTQLGVHVTSWFGYTARIYIGSGSSSDDGKQNAAIAVTNLLVLEARRWLLPWKVGAAFGPYFEGDLTERFDEVYDAAYTAGYPDRRDRIRSMKFGIAVLPYIGVTEHAALELGYVQKLFGYDAPATQFFYAGARAAF